MKIFNFFNSYRTANYFSKVDWFNLKRIVTENFSDLVVYTQEDLEKTKCMKQPKSGLNAFMLSDGTIMDIYYNDFHIHIVENAKDKIVLVSLKRPSEDWILGNDSVGKPLNTNINIYKWYYVTVMEDSHCGNENYDSGSWDVVAYKGMNALVQSIKYLTDREKISFDYKESVDNDED